VMRLLGCRKHQPTFHTRLMAAASSCRRRFVANPSRSRPSPPPQTAAPAAPGLSQVQPQGSDMLWPFQMRDSNVCNSCNRAHLAAAMVQLSTAIVLVSLIVLLCPPPLPPPYTQTYNHLASATRLFLLVSVITPPLSVQVLVVQAHHFRPRNSGPAVGRRRAARAGRWRWHGKGCSHRPQGCGSVWQSDRYS